MGGEKIKTKIMKLKNQISDFDFLEENLFKKKDEQVRGTTGQPGKFRS